jgi:hypothetical protein
VPLTLKEFAEKQERVVQHAGRQLNRLMDINPDFDLIAAIHRWLKNQPLGKGVSPYEIFREVYRPGSFKNG